MKTNDRFATFGKAVVLQMPIRLLPEEFTHNRLETFNIPLSKKVGIWYDGEMIFIFGKAALPRRYQLCMQHL